MSLFLILIQFTLVDNSFALGNNSPAKLKGSAWGCEFFPGFVNKIVQCVTHQTTYKLVQTALTRMHSIFVATANSLVVLYIMFFGIKLSMQQVKDLKKEATVVLLTAFCVLYFNNTTSITKFLNFFITGQEEFVDVATTAMTTKRANANTVNSSDFLCYSYKDRPYTVWQRIDCIIGYIMGIHPLVEYTEKYFSCSKRALEADNLLDEITNPNPSMGCYDYRALAELDNGDPDKQPQPFKDMADEPYKVMQNMGKTKDKFEVGVAFSMLTIITFMLFSDDFGLIVMLTGLFIVIMLIMAFGQAVLVYITSLFMILILGLFAPIIIPMFLFEKTKEIFMAWLNLFFGAMLTPGIMFTYLSFMILTLQYVLNYQVTINGQPVSIRKFHFGDLYINADKNNNTFLQVMSKTDDMDLENPDVWTKFLHSIGAQKTEVRKKDQNVEGSATNNPVQHEKNAPRELAENIPAISGIFKSLSSLAIKAPGGESNNLSLPNISFSNRAEEIKKLYSIQGIAIMLTQMVAANEISPVEALQIARRFSEINDIEVWMKLVNENPALKRRIAKRIAALDRADYNYKLAYMQLLLILFLTLSITYTFMNNVQQFANQLAGASMNPASRMINLYNMTVKRMTASFNK